MDIHEAVKTIIYFAEEMNRVGWQDDQILDLDMQEPAYVKAVLEAHVGDVGIALRKLTEYI